MIEAFIFFNLLKMFSCGHCIHTVFFDVKTPKKALNVCTIKFGQLYRTF